MPHPAAAGLGSNSREHEAPKPTWLLAWALFQLQRKPYSSSRVYSSNPSAQGVDPRCSPAAGAGLHPCVWAAPGPPSTALQPPWYLCPQAGTIPRQSREPFQHIAEARTLNCCIFSNFLLLIQLHRQDQLDRAHRSGVTSAVPLRR